MSCIRSLDAYSKPVQFTYKGESEFNTLVGGIATLISSLLMIVYGG